MKENAQFLSVLLRQGARAFAGYASWKLIDSNPKVEVGFQPDPFVGWQNLLAARIGELAAAVAAHRPQLFVSQVQWASAVLAARGISSDHFREALECLREVLNRELPEHVRPLAEAPIVAALDAFGEPTTDFSAGLLRDSEDGRLASAYLLAVLEGDRRRASRLIHEAVDEGKTVPELYMNVLLPAQQELGRMWMINEINVAEEHFASYTTKMVMDQLLARAEFAPPNGRTIVTSAVAGNRHDIGLQAVAALFEMDGWRSVYLGADVPVVDLADAVEFFTPEVLGLSASQPAQLDTAKTTIETVRRGPWGVNVKILIGGQAFDGLRDYALGIGADAYASNPVEAVEEANAMLAKLSSL